jgi:hypothetical protein
LAAKTSSCYSDIYLVFSKMFNYSFYNNKMLYFALRVFGFLVTNINIKITIYCSPSLLSFSILSLLFLILSSISLPFSLHISPYSLRFLSLISPHVFDLLTVLASPPAPSLSLSSFLPISALSPRPHLCNPLSFFSLTHTLSPPYCTSILLFSLFSLTYLCLCPSTFSLYIFSPGRLLILSFFYKIFFSFSCLSSHLKPVPVYLYFPIVPFFLYLPFLWPTLLTCVVFPFLLLSNRHLYTSSHLFFPSTYSYLALCSSSAPNFPYSSYYNIILPLRLFSLFHLFLYYFHPFHPICLLQLPFFFSSSHLLSHCL